MEYESADDRKARKILPQEQCKRSIGVHLPVIVQFMEEQMVFLDGEPKHDIWKCESLFLSVPL